MRALVITGPGKTEVHDVEDPAAGPGQVVVDIERAGVWGADLNVEAVTRQSSRCAPFSVNAGRHTATYSAPSAPGEL
jgi:D-arabinose 1-dehydrogenase-like Zn-dependent alcohol dehydrogenase